MSSDPYNCHGGVPFCFRNAPAKYKDPQIRILPEFAREVAICNACIIDSAVSDLKPCFFAACEQSSALREDASSGILMQIILDGA